MTPIADMVRVMLERDVSRDDIVTAIEAAERHASNVMSDAMRHVTNRDAKLKAAERSKRYRDKKKRDGSVTPSRDAQNSPLTLTSLPKELSKKKEKKVRARSMPLRDDWQPNGKHYEAAEKLKIPNAAVLEKAEDMRIWAGSTGAMKVDWDLTFHGFLRRDAAKLAAYPPQKPEGVMTDDERDRLFAKLREKPNGQENPRQGSELRAISDGARQDETHRPKDSSDPSDDQSRNGGMGRLDPVFRRPSGVRAGGDETGTVGDGPRIYSAGPIARIV